MNTPDLRHVDLLRVTSPPRLFSAIAAGGVGIAALWLVPWAAWRRSRQARPRHPYRTGTRSEEPVDNGPRRVVAVVAALSIAAHSTAPLVLADWLRRVMDAG